MSRRRRLPKHLKPLLADTVREQGGYRVVALDNEVSVAAVGNWASWGFPGGKAVKIFLRIQRQAGTKFPAEWKVPLSLWGIEE